MFFNSVLQMYFDRACFFATIYGQNNTCFFVFLSWDCVRNFTMFWLKHCFKVFTSLISNLQDIWPKL